MKNMKNTLILFATSAAIGFGANWLYKRYGVKIADSLTTKMVG